MRKRSHFRIENHTSVWVFSCKFAAYFQKTFFKIILKGLAAQKMKFSIKDFFSKWDQIRRKLRIWSRLLKKCLMENFIFCAVTASEKVSFGC